MVPERIRHPDYAHNGIPKSEQVRDMSGIDDAVRKEVG